MLPKCVQRQTRYCINNQLLTIRTETLGTTVFIFPDTQSEANELASRTRNTQVLRPYGFAYFPGSSRGTRGTCVPCMQTRLCVRVNKYLRIWSTAHLLFSLVFCISFDSERNVSKHHNVVTHLPLIKLVTISSFTLFQYTVLWMLTNNIPEQIFRYFTSRSGPCQKCPVWCTSKDKFIKVN